ncbi:TetR family transcriptional regulator [Streptomyces termitum]|uniref:Transcriptional regulator n=1 Tax=Streptomyces termitum TaxID=67368 RepID=A0A918WAY8_9ACTN|nr:TetR/AcrR family transcriptional regulator [Streptomyces termitum]GHA91867.1 transcriptional regulator [Streptomyces termitum]
MSTPRGPYAKTAAKRQKIIEAALAAYAEAGSRKVSVRDIAQRAGMTDAGVLHHFGGREALLTAVLEARDAAGTEVYGSFEKPGAGYADMLAQNAATPGLVKLFVDLAAAAAEPEHPAHDFFTRRYERFRTELTAALTDRAAERGREATGAGSRLGSTSAAGPVDPAWAARILIAATDGLQLQWLLNPEIDMAADLDRLADLLIDRTGASPDAEAAGYTGTGASASGLAP